jgi:hypothetical protein
VLKALMEAVLRLEMALGVNEEIVDMRTPARNGPWGLFLGLAGWHKL